MKTHNTARYILILAAILIGCLGPAVCSAEAKKGLLVYASGYGSTIEIAYWIKAIIGIEQTLDVKKFDQVITVAPYDYVIIGRNAKQETPSPSVYKFVETYQQDLAKKQLCYFLGCGDWDETMLLKVPGREVHQIAGRNYLYDIQEKFPAIKPVVIGGFGGRQVMPSLQGMDKLQIWLLERLAKEGCAWVGLDIWESLVPERVEAFANEVRAKVLGLPVLDNVQQFRGFWNSLQPGSLQEPSKQKYTVRPYTVQTSTEKIFFSRSRIRGDLEAAVKMLSEWAQQECCALQEQRKTFFNVYYRPVKNISGNDMVIHVVPGTMPDDPGNVHVSFRSYDKPDVRKPLEEAIGKAEQMLWADGRKVEGR